MGKMWYRVIMICETGNFLSRDAIAGITVFVLNIKLCYIW